MIDSKIVYAQFLINEKNNKELAIEYIGLAFSDGYDCDIQCDDCLLNESCEDQV